MNSATTLGEIATLNYGKALPERDRRTGDVPVYGSGGIGGFHNESLIASGIIIGRKGTIGSVRFSDVPFYPIDTVFYIDKVAEGYDIKFYYYFLQSIGLSGFDSDAAVPGLSRNLVHKLKAQLPDLPAQRSIASILSAYDELIEVNSQRIRLLEDTARELYKEWFVRLRFPGYKEAKFVKGVPEGWEIKKLGQVLELAYGKALKEDVRSGGKYPVYGSSGVVGFHDTFIVPAPGIVVGRKGNVGSVFWVPSPCYPIDTAFYVKSSVCLEYLYFNLQHQHFIEGDAAVPGLNRNQAYSNFLFLPPENLLLNFSGFVNPIFQQIETLQQQSAQLRQIRDCLLPRLISGKLQLKEAAPAKSATIIDLTPHAMVAEEAPGYRSSKKLNPLFTRRVLAAYIIDKLHTDRHFGHVKLMKLMYLCEHLAHIETAAHYHRDAAGPYDNQMIRSIDSQLKKAAWFEAVKQGTDKFAPYKYFPLARKDEYKPWFNKYYSDKQEGIDRLIALFGTKVTEKVEMVATLYEAWRYLKEDSALPHPGDDAIVREVLKNWHVSKERIPEDKWRKCLVWMREEQGWVA